MWKTTKTALLAAAMLSASSAPAGAQDNVSQEVGPVEPAPSEQFQGTTTGTDAAAPQPAAGPFRVYGGLRIGVGSGFKELKPNDPDFIATAPATPGLQVGAEYLLLRYLALGLETRLNWARARAGGDRAMLWDLVLRPRTNYQLPNKPIEVYAALPVGLSIINMPEDYATGKAGATLGLSGGANYFFTSSMGLNMEMGWLWHWSRDEVEGVEETFRLGQWTLVNVNFLYAF